MLVEQVATAADSYQGRDFSDLLKVIAAISVNQPIVELPPAATPELVILQTILADTLCLFRQYYAFQLCRDVPNPSVVMHSLDRTSRLGVEGRAPVFNVQASWKGLKNSMSIMALVHQPPYANSVVVEALSAVPYTITRSHQPYIAWKSFIESGKVIDPNIKQVLQRLTRIYHEVNQSVGTVLQSSRVRQWRQ